MKRLKQAWKRDRLGVLGVGSAVVAFALWFAPGIVGCFAGVQSVFRFVLPEGRLGGCVALVAFVPYNLPAAATCLALAVILLRLGRR